jgi:hypothetical protein
VYSTTLFLPGCDLFQHSAGMMIEPGSASRVPAGRFAAHEPVPQQCRTLRGGSTPETNPLPYTLRLAFARILFVST